MTNLKNKKTKILFIYIIGMMVNTEIILIMFFAAKDCKAPYNQLKQDWSLTVAQIMNSLLQNSDLKRRK